MLDTYFRNYFWTFHVAAVVVAGILSARTVNAFVKRSLQVPPDQVVALAPASTPETESKVVPVRIESFLEKNLFDALREDLQAEKKRQRELEEQKEQDAQEPGDVDTSQCVKGAAGTLLATVVSNIPERSVAVFLDPSDPENPKAYRPGDEFGDGVIARVDWRIVYLTRDDRCEMISLDDEQRGRPVVAQRAPQKSDDDDDLGKGVKKLGGGQYEIPKAEIENVLSNLNKLATQARIVPSFKDGKANGFKLFSIRPNSLYAKIGIQNGDVVQRINGFEMNSPDKALEIYGKLKDANKITVDLQRRGKSKTMTYNIR